MADKTDHLSRDLVSHIKDLEIQKGSGSIYHGFKSEPRFSSHGDYS